MISRHRHPIASVLFGITAVALLLITACSGMPTLEEQKTHILNRNFQLDLLSPEAFVEAWGAAPYQYQATMQFFPLRNGQYMPHFRVPLGEAPAGWDSTVVFGPSLFFAYPEQGELIGFMDDRLVYREVVPAAELHALGKSWANERKFKTTIETGTAKPR
jgi:hypothetical protein